MGMKHILIFTFGLLSAALHGQARDTILYFTHNNPELNRATLYYTGNVDSLISSISSQVYAQPEINDIGKGLRYRYLESQLPHPIFELMYFDIVVSKFNTSRSEDVSTLYITFTSASGTNVTDLMFEFANEQLTELFETAIEYGFTGASGD